MNYLDRNNIAAAKLAGIVPDLKLHGVQFQVCLYERRAYERIDTDR